MKEKPRLHSHEWMIVATLILLMGGCTFVAFRKSSSHILEINDVSEHLNVTTIPAKKTSKPKKKQTAEGACKKKRPE